jgi:hypothetical protein
MSRSARFFITALLLASLAAPASLQAAGGTLDPNGRSSIASRHLGPSIDAGGGANP